jgi:hypothetical protein
LNSFFDCEYSESAAWPARLRQTNDLAGGRKQIPPRYAGIGARYGLACATLQNRGDGAGAIDFSIFKQGIVLTGRELPTEADG